MLRDVGAGGAGKGEQHAGLLEIGRLASLADELLEQARGAGEVRDIEGVANLLRQRHLFCWLAVCIAWNMFDM